MRCQRLNDDGKRCKRKATVFVTMHMNEQCYGSEPNWGVMGVCSHHSDLIKYKVDNKTDFPVSNKNRLSHNALSTKWETQGEKE